MGSEFKFEGNKPAPEKMSMEESVSNKHVCKPSCHNPCLLDEREVVPDLYELAFMPGQFRCPKCGFILSKQTMDATSGRIGLTQSNRETEPCPNDGTMMVCVTYREQVQAYADRLKEEFDRDLLIAALRALVALATGK